MKNLTIYILAAFLTLPAIAQKIEFKEPKKVDGLNSTAEESLPLYDAYSNTMYLVRTMHEDNTGGKKSGNEIWAFDRKENKEFKASSYNFDNLNNESSNAVVGIANNGKKLYLLNKYNPEFGMLPGVSTSVLKAGKWSVPRALTIKGVDPNTTIYNVYVHSSEEVMLLSMKNSTPDSSFAIFISQKKNGRWSVPQALASVNSTTSNQITPYLSPDKKTLYFSSDRKGGKGGYDIYKANAGDNMTQWNDIKPLKVLNSSAFDAYFTIADAGATYFSSNRDGGLSSIFKSNLIIEFKDSVKEVKIDYANEVVESIYPNVNFAFDSYELNESAKDFLGEIEDSLKSNPTWKLNLEGHTDSKGTNSYNKVLSKNRAQAVQKHLLSRGIDPKRISISYYGERKPTATNKTDYGRFKNRRVELSFKK